MGPQLSIMSARHGGFLVLGSGDYGDARAPLFAGSLTDALEFMRAHLAAIKPEPVLKGE